MYGWAPIYVYWALILIGVLPLVSVNRVAAIVFAARLGTQAAYDLGFNQPVWQSAFYNEPVSQVGVFFICGILAMHNARGLYCFAAAALFVPMAIAAAYQIDYPSGAGWAVYGLAVTQAVILIALGEWRKAVQHWLDATDPKRSEFWCKLVAFARGRTRLHA